VDPSLNLSRGVRDVLKTVKKFGFDGVWELRHGGAAGRPPCRKMQARRRRSNMGAAVLFSRKRNCRGGSVLLISEKEKMSLNNDKSCAFLIYTPCFLFIIPYMCAFPLSCTLAFSYSLISIHWLLMIFFFNPMRA
jgi:hypothetical protein